MSQVQLIRAFFAEGGIAHRPYHRYRFELKDCPTNGYTRVVIVRGEKRSTLLCPHTLWTAQVSNKAGEIAGAEVHEISNERLGALITEAWRKSAEFGMQRDYGVAALVLTELGQPVPTFIPKVSADDGERKVGGKPVVEAFLKPCRPTSKRAEVARFFMHEQPQSLHEAMARLGLTRSGVLSHLFTLNRDHGVGYELVSDCARLVVPEGFDLFDFHEPERAARPEGEVKPAGEPKRRGGGKPIDPEKLAPIPQPGKRANVAEFFLQWHDLDDAMAKLELNRSAVLSHLFTINKENGLGYELSEDGKQARLLIPEGHEVFCAKQPRAKKAQADGT
jgi:hypothetical protein